MSNWQASPRQEPPVIILDEQGNPEPVLHFYPGKPAVTLTLLAVMIVAFIAEVFTGALDDITRLIALGAKYNPAIASGELWRLLSCVFLHGDLMHLLFNGYALYIWGPMTERLFGRAKMLGIFLTAGLLGSVASYAFSASVSVGASGAIFGLLGALLTLRWHDRNIFRRLFGPQLIIILVFNLVNGFTVRNIDNFGHFGGLAGGFLAACMLGFYRQRPKLRNFLLSLLLMAALASGGLMAGNARWQAQAQAQAALSALQSGDVQAALVHAEAAAQSKAGQDEWVRGIVTQSYDSYVVASYQQNQTQTALAYARKLVDYAPDYTRGYYMFTVLLCDQAEYDQAREVLAAGREKAANDAHLEMAEAYLRYTADADAAGAIQALERALALEPDNELAKLLLEDMQSALPR